MNTMQRLASVDDAAKLLGGISRPTLYRMIKAGQITAIKLGRRTFVPLSSIDDFVAAAPKLQSA